MKKTIGIIFGMLFLGTAINSVSAQDKPKAGDLIYGTVTDSQGPVAGVVITERNRFDRIMAQVKTDENGNFSFRLVNPDNMIMIADANHEQKKMEITKCQYQVTLAPATVDYKLLGIIVPDTIKPEHLKRQDIYLPYRDGTTYGSIQELCDNLYLSRFAYLPW